jgi:hypothetical protein
MYRRIVAQLTIVALVSFLSVGALAEEGKQAVDARDSGLACVAKGAGVTYFAFCPTNTGRIYQIISPSGIGHVYFNDYCLSTSTGDYAGSGSGYVAGSFYEVAGTRYQPGGAGTLPLKITVRTNDNNWQIVWTYAYNVTDVELLVTAAVKKLLSAASYAYLNSRGDFDIDNHVGEAGDASFGSGGSSGWMRSTTPGHALTLLGHTRTIYNQSYIHSGFGGNGCFASSIAAPTTGDLGMSNYYYLAGFNAGQTKTVKFQFQRQ